MSRESMNQSFRAGEAPDNIVLLGEGGHVRLGLGLVHL